MSAETKVAYAKEWYAKGVCPGCGSSLAVVAGQGVGHVRPEVRFGKTHEKWSGPTGAPVGAGNVGPNTCYWSADDLTSLVLLATDFGRALDRDGEASPGVPLPPSGASPSEPVDDGGK